MDWKIKIDSFSQGESTPSLTLLDGQKGRESEVWKKEMMAIK